jgi:hypothetical protein
MSYIIIFTYPIVRKLLFVLLIFLLAGCVMPVRPPGKHIFTPPDPTPGDVSITVVRASQFIGSYPIHYVALDGKYIASLKTGQYTKIPISKGRHELAVTRYIGGLFIVMPYFIGGTPETKDPPEYTAKCDFECHLDDTCFFGIRVKFPSSKPIELFLIDKLDGEFSLEGKTLVNPGSAEE